jgi:hypothetical protein
MCYFAAGGGNVLNVQRTVKQLINFATLIACTHHSTISCLCQLLQVVATC